MCAKGMLGNQRPQKISGCSLSKRGANRIIEYINIECLTVSAYLYLPTLTILKILEKQCLYERKIILTGFCPWWKK